VSTRTTGRNFTDKQLAGLERSNIGKWNATLQKLIAELRAERRLSEHMTKAYVRERAARVELDRQVRPNARILVVDCPVEPDERAEGETIVYSDGLLDVCTVSCPVGWSHPKFEQVLEAVLSETPRRFQGMPGSLSCRLRSIVRYPRDLHKEVEALIAAQDTQEVLDLLGELRERLDEKKPAEKQEQEPSETRADESAGKISVPW
jgi:hypothetical protein